MSPSYDDDEDTDEDLEAAAEFLKLNAPDVLPPTPAAEALYDRLWEASFDATMLAVDRLLGRIDT